MRTRTKIQMLAVSLLTPVLLLPPTVLSQPPLRRGEVETLLTLPEGNRPEGIAVSHRGAVYVGNRIYDGPTINNQILAVNNDGVATVFAPLPPSSSMSQGLLGLAIDRWGNIYAALASFDPATHGVYSISADGNDIERLTGSENIAFPQRPHVRCLRSPVRVRQHRVDLALRQRGVSPSGHRIPCWSPFPMIRLGFRCPEQTESASTTILPTRSTSRIRSAACSCESTSHRTEAQGQSCL